MSGAREGTRTLKPCGTGSLILRVYQFRHSRVLETSPNYNTASGDATEDFDQICF